MFRVVLATFLYVCCLRNLSAITTLHNLDSYENESDWAKYKFIEQGSELIEMKEATAAKTSNEASLQNGDLVAIGTLII